MASNMSVDGYEYLLRLMAGNLVTGVFGILLLSDGFRLEFCWWMNIFCDKQLLEIFRNFSRLPDIYIRSNARWYDHQH